VFQNTRDRVFDDKLN